MDFKVTDLVKNVVLAGIGAAAVTTEKAKDVADETIRAFNKYGKSNPNIAEMERKRSAIGKELSKKQAKASAIKKDVVNHNVPKHLRIGDSVKVISMNMKGTVTSLPNAKGDLTVQMGIMNSKVNIKDLILLEVPDAATKASGGGKKARRSGGSMGLGKAATISPEINLLGLGEGRHYPNERFWTIAGETENRAIIGVDAHDPASIGKHRIFEAALALAERCGLEVEERMEFSATAPWRQRL